MTSNFDRWEKDPFFSAAEEVQESADRMESAYRTWLHSMKDDSIEWNRDDLRRELCTALDTAKWQLEEFERAVQSSYKNNGADEAKNRHCQFVLAMANNISLIQKSVQESVASDGKPSSPSVRMNEGELDELALFLSGPMASGPSGSQCLRSALYPSGQHVAEGKKGKFSGHRRSASANADISSWNITVDEDELASHHSSARQVELPPRRVPSFSTFVGTMESAPKLKLPKNGFRKWRPADCQQEDDVALLRSQPQSRGSQTCYERNKSCLDSCDDCYDKQLHGWYGALHRLVQRLVYQVQYIRSMQTTIWVALLLFSMVVFLVRVFRS